MRLLIRNLDRSTTEADLQGLFETFGPVQSCTIVLDAETGQSKGFGFIEMPKVGDAKAAVRNLNGVELDGERIRVKNAQTKPAKVDPPPEPEIAQDPEITQDPEPPTSN